MEKNTALLFTLILLLAVSPSLAAKPAFNPDVATVDIVRHDAVPNLGTEQYIEANVSYKNGSLAPNEYCTLVVFRLNANASELFPVMSIDSNRQCLNDNALSGNNYDCNTYSDGNGELYTSYIVDPGIFELGDAGTIEVHCSAAYDYADFKVENYRPVDSFFGSVFQYLINNPATIFGLFVFILTFTIISVIVLVLPIIIFRRLFGK